MQYDSTFIYLSPVNYLAEILSIEQTTIYIFFLQDGQFQD